MRRIILFATGAAAARTAQQGALLMPLLEAVAEQRLRLRTLSDFELLAHAAGEIDEGLDALAALERSVRAMQLGECLLGQRGPAGAARAAEERTPALVTRQQRVDHHLAPPATWAEPHAHAARSPIVGRRRCKQLAHASRLPRSECCKWTEQPAVTQRAALLHDRPDRRARRRRNDIIRP